MLLEEFGNVIARGGSGIVIASQSGHRLGALGPEQAVNSLNASSQAAPKARPDHGAPASLEGIERDHILDVLRQVNGNRMAAAKLLGISRRALYRRLERHNLADEAPSPGAKRS